MTGPAAILGFALGLAFGFVLMGFKAATGLFLIIPGWSIALGIGAILLIVGLVLVFFDSTAKRPGTR